MRGKRRRQWGSCSVLGMLACLTTAAVEVAGCGGNRVVPAAVERPAVSTTLADAGPDGEAKSGQCRALQPPTSEPQLVPEDTILEIDNRLRHGQSWGPAASAVFGSSVHDVGPCELLGLCTKAANQCTASSANECKSSIACAVAGHCALGRGRCEVGREEDCRRALVCRKEGRCVASASSKSLPSGLCTVAVIGGTPLPRNLNERAARLADLAASENTEDARKAFEIGFNSGISELRQAVCAGAARSRSSALRALRRQGASHMDPYTREACVRAP